MRSAAVALALALTLLARSATAANPPAARLQGSFAMDGVLTTADNVYGEHRGGAVQRLWTFLPTCAIGSCRHVVLKRQRSGRRILDTVTLTRQAPNLYVGHGQFWISLRCAGQIIPHGGLATETITVTITETATASGTTRATGITATYVNPSRVNRTRCPGAIGHDAATYHGLLIDSNGTGSGGSALP